MTPNFNNVKLEISAGRKDQFPKRRICNVVVSGRSNVGKSSLINTLLGRTKLAHVSSSPGKTVTVNFYNVDDKLYFVDLPGYGFASRSSSDKARWSKLVDDYFSSMADRNDDMLVVQLVDMRVGPTKDDETMLEWMNEAGVNYVVCATKSDKLNKTEFFASMNLLNSCESIEEGTDIIPFSSRFGDGKNELIGIILDFAEL